jgi:hypothetical protein
MEQDLLFCHICKQYYEVNYSNEIIVSEEKCGCKSKPKLINGMKPLDHAIKLIKEVLNEKSNHRTRKVPKRS